LELASAWPLRIDDGWKFRLMMGKCNEVPSPQPVGSFPEGVSFYGVFGLAGNVSEWVEDWYNREG